ncbi:hypothetical protein PG996_014186 [Apiospora saccharicola]|uniref:Uncharacterized protein n=1 Tax=Apiospora saccharicola TaxID=335842 RepID=A0ABR1THQ4_9PEZI
MASRYTNPNYVAQEVSAYNLDWSKLRRWLVGERFKDEPELATSLEQTKLIDSQAIERLRDVKAEAEPQTLQRDHTPDPNPACD